MIIVHLHAPYIAFLCLPVAAKYGISHLLYIAMQLYMRKVKEKQCGIECFGVYPRSTLPIGSDALRQQERFFLAKKIILC